MSARKVDLDAKFTSVNDSLVMQVFNSRSDGPDDVNSISERVSCIPDVGILFIVASSGADTVE